MSRRRVESEFSLLAFCYSFATGLPMGLIVLFVQQRGVNLVQIGALLAIQSITIVLLELPTGGLADLWGRKRVLVLSFLASAAYTALALASSSFAGFATAMVLSGVGRALLSGTAEALFVDSLQAADAKADLHRGFAWLLTAAGLGIGLGSLAGGFSPALLSHLPAGLASRLTPLAMPLLLALGVWLALAAAAAAVLREPAMPARDSPPRTTSGLTAILGQSVRSGVRDPQVFAIVLAGVSWAMAFSAVEAFWQPHFAHLLGGAAKLTQIFGAISAAIFLLSSLGSVLAVPAGRLAKRRYGLAGAVVAAVAGVALLVLAGLASATGAFAALLAAYLLSGLAGPLFQALFNEAIPARNRATMISFQALCTRLGVLGGGLGFGYLAWRFSTGTAWVGAGAVMLLLVAPLYGLAELRRARARAGDATTPPALEAPATPAGMNGEPPLASAAGLGGGGA